MWSAKAKLSPLHADAELRRAWLSYVVSKSETGGSGRFRMEGRKLRLRTPHEG